MREINLDATTWGDRDDFYRELLPALGAPPWHGRNLDALSDSLRGNDLNKVKLPLSIKIDGVTAVPPDLISYLQKFAQLVDDLRAEGWQISLAIT